MPAAFDFNAIIYPAAYGKSRHRASAAFLVAAVRIDDARDDDCGIDDNVEGESRHM